MVYSQRLWSQDVYQLPPDSCVGWPAVNCVSDSPLLLLIVSISVPPEKWDCYGQTQAIDLQFVPDLPAATGRGGGRAEPPWHPQTRCLPPEIQYLITSSGDFFVFKLIFCIPYDGNGIKPVTVFCHALETKSNVFRVIVYVHNSSFIYFSQKSFKYLRNTQFL